MLKKCLCCGRGAKQEKEQDSRHNGQQRELQQTMKDQSIKRNTKILREDLYQNYMKPYFKLGYDYKEFTKLFFQKEVYEDQLIGDEEEDNQRKRNWCERNLIIKDPSSSRLYFIWEFIFLTAFLFEIVLVPYT